MAQILILACEDCNYIFENEHVTRCPRCNSDETEIIDVEEVD